MAQKYHFFHCSVMFYCKHFCIFENKLLFNEEHLKTIIINDFIIINYIDDIMQTHRRFRNKNSST